MDHENKQFVKLLWAEIQRPNVTVHKNLKTMGWTELKTLMGLHGNTPWQAFNVAWLYWRAADERLRSLHDTSYLIPSLEEERLLAEKQMVILMIYDEGRDEARMKTLFEVKHREF